MLISLKLDSLDESFFFLKKKRDFKETSFYLYKNHTGAASDIYLSENNNIVFKVKRCKYQLGENWFRWFFRDFLKKILIFRLDSRREYKCFIVARSAGLKTPDVYGWGVPTHLLSNILSFVCTEYMGDATPGIVFFKNASAKDKICFVNEITADLIKLANYGYYYRDLNLGNVLVGDDKKLIWIDTHFNKVSKFKRVRLRQVFNSIINKNSGLDDYKEVIMGEINKNVV